VNLISVPYFIGLRMDGFRTPEPAAVLDPPLPGDPGADYSTSNTGGPGELAQRRMGVLYRALAENVAGADHPVVYAGDCVAVIGVLAGLQQRKVHPTLYWFDAHGDFNTWDTTPSGFLGGMPLAMLTGRGEQVIVDGVGLVPIADERVVLVDARDLDPGEDEAVAASGMRVRSVDDVAHEEPSDRPIYVHVDVDVVDPVDLPAINYPAPGGPSLQAVHDAVHRLAGTGRVAAASVSSWNPRLPGADLAAAATRRIMGDFLES
jgi:arginase